MPVVLQVFVERQGLVNLSGQVQPDIVIQAAVIGVERATHPLEFSAGRFFLVIVAVVHLHNDDIILIAEIHKIREIKPTRRNTVLELADGFSIDPKAHRLASALQIPGRLFHPARWRAA